MNSAGDYPTLTLNIAEARLQDAGRSLARLDPADIARLSLPIGGIVQIAGKRITAAKVLPAFRDLRGKQIIQIDGLTRNNAGAVIGEKVKLTPIEVPRAVKLVLVPEGAQVWRQASGELISRSLLDQPLTVGDRIRVSLFGSRHQEFRVAECTPPGTVMVGRETAIRVEAPGAAAENADRVSYEDIGGLADAVQRVREMIELPLLHPELFGRLGIDPPKGVLLHGPPGCGKTLLARAVANETHASFFSLGGPEIISKYYGESEARLRQLFDEAKKDAPSIIFLDEIDAIAPKRENTVGEVEKRVVAQLLALMDGLEARGQIIVIAATNLPNSLDPALRRPGRFDREIAIGVPDVRGRREMVEIHTRGMPLASDVNTQVLAEMTHGFTGADIAALCREAAMTALRRVLPRLDLTSKSLPLPELHELQVGGTDFAKALHEVEPSALREFLVEIANVTWDDIGGLDNAKRELREAIEWPVHHPELYEAAGLRPAKGILLYGPPGTGKTLLAKAAARQFGVNFIAVRGPELMSRYVGESEKALREVFRKARQAAPCVVFFDEIDALVPRRSIAANDGHAGERIVAQMLSEMDGVEELQGVLVLAATNRLDMIDPALLRPGRFDSLIEVGAPTLNERAAILRVHTRTAPLAAEVDMPALAQRTEGFSGADLQKLVREAAMSSLREFLGNEANQDGATLQIGQQHFEQALAKARPESL